MYSRPQYSACVASRGSHGKAAAAVSREGFSVKGSRTSPITTRGRRGGVGPPCEHSNHRNQTGKHALEVTQRSDPDGRAALNKRG